MKKIITLPEHIISRIAAGEVIERPAYAVKELIENAIDAGADSITIHIEDSGLKKITVSDNGEGMSKDDIQESFKPHTTSKVIDETLVGIKTLGFRGEALSSIASISQMTIQSRTADNPSGVQLTLKGAAIEHIGPIGMPPGTTITVQNLFHTVPARKKFLKTARTEFRHILDLISSYTLAYPNIKFLLTHNKRTVLDVSKNQSREQRIEKVLGPSFASHLLPIASTSSYVQIEGFIAHPQLTTRTQSKQYIFINNRFVTDRLITTAVKEAYGNLLENTQFPVFMLFLQLPHESVDVNVHPRKEQVSFVNHTMVFDTVKEAVAKTLANNNLTFYNASFNAYSPRAGTTSSYAAKALKHEVTPWTVKDDLRILKTADIQQLHNTYLLVQTQQGILLIDQHAAHERILYQQFKDAFVKKRKKQEQVILPSALYIDLSLSEAEVLEEYQETLSSFGFVLEHFKDTTYAITAVPALFQDRDLKTLITEMLEELATGKHIADIDHFSDLMISFLACRAAIKAGDTLTRDEAKKLIEKLQETEQNATCPHGRPTQIEMGVDSLHKMFKRK